MGLSHRTTALKESKLSTLKGWTDKQFKELLKTPGNHKHPSVVGFSMRVSPKLKAVWAYKFRGKDSQERSGTLGPITSMSLASALAEYEDVREKDAGGKQEQEKPPLTLAVGFERWLEEHRVHRKGKPLSPETVRSYRGIYSLYLAPVGELVLADTTTADWRQILEVCAAQSPHQARRAFALLSGMYSHFIGEEELEKNPIAKKTLRARFAPDELTSERRTTHLSLDKFAEFWQALQKKPEGNRRPVEMLMLTGWRLSGVLALELPKVDFDEGFLELGGTEKGWKGLKGKIAINEVALDMLKRQKEKVSGKYAFPARHITGPRKKKGTFDEAAAKALVEQRKKEGDHRKEVRGTLKSICEEIGVERIGAHDLRRTFAIVADVVLNGNVLLIGRLLGHSAMKTETEKVEKQAVKGKVTQFYMVRGIVAERASSLRVANAILGLCKAAPLDPELLEQFKERGVQLAYEDLAGKSDDDED